eukprot:6751835-Lingulodinium_polyedra.AAC.1
MARPPGDAARGQRGRQLGQRSRGRGHCRTSGPQQRTHPPTSGRYSNHGSGRGGSAAVVGRPGDAVGGVGRA